MQFLKPSQIYHTQRLIDIRKKNISPFICDFSVPGAGKTHVANAIGVELNIPLFVLCLRGCIKHWEDVGDEMDKQLGRSTCTNVMYAITYESLRSTTGRQPKHGYLTRTDSADGKVEFEVTSEFKKLVNSGIILVLDECQKIKNVSDQTIAVRVLINEILSRPETGSTVLFLSGTPFEEAEHAINFFRTIGFIKSDKLFEINRGTKELIPIGLKELIEKVKPFDDQEVEDLVLGHTPYDHKKVKDLVISIFGQIIVPHFSSSMPSPIIDYTKDVGNGFYNFVGETSEKDAEGLLKAISYLQDLVSGTKRQELAVKGFLLSEITTTLREIELAKVPLFHRIAVEALAKGEKNKVVFFLNYRESIDRLSSLLVDHKPLVYDGRLTNPRQETEILDAFNKQGRRLLIASLRKGGLGISLHDTIGDEPRESYISPTYSFIDMHQASNRIYRQGLMSNAFVRVVYGEVGRIESHLLNILNRKTENLKKILRIQAQEGLPFPGEYPAYHEI